MAALRARGETRRATLKALREVATRLEAANNTVVRATDARHRLIMKRRGGDARRALVDGIAAARGAAADAFEGGQAALAAGRAALAAVASRVLRLAAPASGDALEPDALDAVLPTPTPAARTDRSPMRALEPYGADEPARATDTRRVSHARDSRQAPGVDEATAPRLPVRRLADAGRQHLAAHVALGGGGAARVAGAVVRRSDGRRGRGGRLAERRSGAPTRTDNCRGAATRRRGSAREPRAGARRRGSAAPVSGEARRGGGGRGACRGGGGCAAPFPGARITR